MTVYVNAVWESSTFSCANGLFAEHKERVRISERVKAGLETARAKGKRLGRPRVIVDSRRIATLRSRGASWATVCQETGLSSAPFTACPKTGALLGRRPPTDLSGSLLQGWAEDSSVPTLSGEHCYAE